MVRSLLLEGVSPQEYQTMRACLGVHEQSFRPDDVIYDLAMDGACWASSLRAAPWWSG